MIRLFTRPMCAGCEEIRGKLRTLGEAFEEVQMDEVNLAEIATGLRTSGRITKLDQITAPVLHVQDGEREIWFDYPAIVAELEQYEEARA